MRGMGFPFPSFSLGRRPWKGARPRLSSAAGFASPLLRGEPPGRGRDRSERGGGRREGDGDEVQGGLGAEISTGGEGRREGEGPAARVREGTGGEERVPAAVRTASLRVQAEDSGSPAPRGCLPEKRRPGRVGQRAWFLPRGHPSAGHRSGLPGAVARRRRRRRCPARSRPEERPRQPPQVRAEGPGPPGWAEGGRGEGSRLGRERAAGSRRGDSPGFKLGEELGALYLEGLMKERSRRCPPGFPQDGARPPGWGRGEGQRAEGRVPAPGTRPRWCS